MGEFRRRLGELHGLDLSCKHVVEANDGVSQQLQNARCHGETDMNGCGRTNKGSSMRYYNNSSGVDLSRAFFLCCHTCLAHFGYHSPTGLCSFSTIREE